MREIRILWLFLLALAVPASADILRVGTVCDGGCNYPNSQLSQALYDAKLGDTIVLTAGETFVCNCFLPAKKDSRGNGEEWLTITSSRANELPPYGYRVGPQHAPLMAKIVTANNEPAMTWEYGVGPIESVDLANGLFTINMNQIYGPSTISNGDRVTLRDQNSNDGVTPLKANTPYYVVNKNGASFQLSDTRGGSPIRPITYTPQANWPRIVITRVDPVHHVRLRGLEITTDGGGPLVYSLLRFGNMQEASYESLPYAMEVAHCYLHGQRLDATEGPRNAIMFSGAVDIHDNYIADIKDTNGDANGISSFIAPGPVRVVNNYVESAAINSILGGGSAQIVGMVNGERGGVFQHNFYTKQGAWKYRADTNGVSNTPPTGPCLEDEYVKYTNINQGWRCTAAGTWERRDDLLAERQRKYLCKNVFEFKSAKNMFVEGNLFEKAWVDGQLGDAILMQTIDRNQWYSPWTEFADIVFRSNISRKTSTGMTLYMIDQSQPNKNRNITIENNLWYDIGKGGVGDMMRVEWGQRDLVFRHNTVAARDGYRGLVFFVDADNSGGQKGQRYMVQDSIYGNGPASFNMNCGVWDNVTANSKLSRVLIWNPNSNGVSNMSGSCSDNFQSMSGGAAADLFENSDASDYRVKTSSPAYRTASDGRDLGVDFIDLNAATSNVEAGTPTWAVQSNLRIEAGSAKALVSYRRPAGTTGCTMLLYNDYARTTLHADTSLPQLQTDDRPSSVVSTTGEVQFVLGATTALSASTFYWGVLTCGTQVMPFELRTTPAGFDTENELQFSTARTVSYAGNAALTGATTLPAATLQKVPVAAGAVVYVREGPDGPVRVLLNR